MCRNSSHCFQCNKCLFDQFSLTFESTTPSSRHPFLAPHLSTLIFFFSLHNSSQAATFSHSTETSHIFRSLSTYGRALRLQIENCITFSSSEQAARKNPMKISTLQCRIYGLTYDCMRWCANLNPSLPCCDVSTFLSFAQLLVSFHTVQKRLSTGQTTN